MHSVESKSDRGGAKTFRALHRFAARGFRGPGSGSASPSDHGPGIFPPVSNKLPPSTKVVWGETMRTRLGIAALALCAALGHFPAAAQDIVLFNGKIVTVDDRFTIAQAVA